MRRHKIINFWSDEDNTFIAEVPELKAHRLMYPQSLYET